MNKDVHIDEALLLRYFEEKLGEEEKDRVRSWMDESAEHEKMARDLYYIYFALDTVQTIRDIDAEDALSLVHRKIDKRKNVSVLRWLQRVAAILFIPLLSVWVYNEYKPEPVRYAETRTTPGMITSVELPDGSKVWLNSNSYLRYPVKFSKDQREVFLRGEAYFSVAKEKRKKFVVNTSQELKVEVLGTEFNMDAYEGSDFVATTLVEGSVRLSYRKTDKEEHYLMRPAQKVVYNLRDGSLLKTNNIYVQKDISWKDGRIVLRNTPLGEVVWILSKRFNVDFRIEKEALGDNSFTGTFDDQSLTRILDHLKISSKINYRFEKETADNRGNILKDRVILY